MIAVSRILLFAMLFGLPLSPAAAEVARGRLRQVSLDVAAAFNAADGATLHGMLAPDLRLGAAAPSLGERLESCRQRFGALERLSLPVMGTRTYGMFAAYFDGTVRDLFLEIDQDGQILHLAIAGADGSCNLAGD